MDAILTDFLYQRQSGGFLINDGDNFRAIQEYLDAWEVIENHQRYIAEEVKKSEDIDYIRSMYGKLDSAIRELEEKFEILKKNPLYKKFQKGN